MMSNATTRNLRHAPHSSYESLDKFNSTSETLKITDDFHQQKHNIISTMTEIPTCEVISKAVSSPNEAAASTSDSDRINQ